MVSLQLGPPAGFVEFFGPLGDLARIGSVNHDRSNLVLEDIRQPFWCGWGPRFVAPSEVASTHHGSGGSEALTPATPPRGQRRKVGKVGGNGYGISHRCGDAARTFNMESPPKVIRVNTKSSG